MIRFLHQGTSAQTLRRIVSRRAGQQCGKNSIILCNSERIARSNNARNTNAEKKANVSVILIKPIKNNWIARNAPIVGSQLQLSMRNYRNDRTDPVSENDSMIFINNCTVYIWACVNFAWNYMKAIYFWTDNHNFNKRLPDPRVRPVRRCKCVTENVFDVSFRPMLHENLNHNANL